MSGVFLYHFLCYIFLGQGIPRNLKLISLLRLGGQQTPERLHGAGLLGIQISVPHSCKLFTNRHILPDSRPLPSSLMVLTV